MSANYLVRLNEDYYFLEFGMDAADIRGTRVLSLAEHLTYFAADVLAQSLRQRKYDAVVTDVYGREVTQEVLDENEIAADTLPEMAHEFYAVPVGVMKRRYFSEALFRNRVDEAVQKGWIPQPMFLKEEQSDAGAQALQISGAVLAQMIPTVATKE